MAKFLTRKNKKTVITVVCVALAAVLLFGVFASFGGKEKIAVNLEDVVAVNGSASKVYLSQFALEPGVDNAVEFTVDAEESGVYEVLFRIPAGESTRVYLKNVTYDAENNLVCPYVSTNLESVDMAYPNEYSKYALYVNLVKGENTLQYFTATGSITVEAITLKQKTGSAQVKLVDLPTYDSEGELAADNTSTDVYTVSTKVAHESGVSYGPNYATNSVVLLGGEEYSDTYAHTFAVSKSGTYDIGMFAAGQGAVGVRIVTNTGELVFEYEGDKSIEDLYDNEVQGGRSGSAAYIDLGKRVSLKEGVTYTVTIRTNSWINYAGMVFSK